MYFDTPKPGTVSYPYTADSFNSMPYRRLGDSGLWASNVGLGTWKMGYPHTGDGSRVEERTAFRLLDCALEQGVTFWDTANRYNNGTGNAETVLGRWFSLHPARRNDIVLATKVQGGMDGFTPNHGGLSRQSILNGVYNCLNRLKTDHIDILYFHRFETRAPIEESLETVEDLVRRDLVRYFAVSNFTPENLEAYKKAAGSLSRRVKICAVQNDYNILTGEAQKGVLDTCAAEGMSFIAYSPLARGLLTGKYRTAEDITSASRMAQEGLNFTEADFARLRSLIAIAEGAGLPLSAMVLAYMLTLPGMGPVIPSGSSEAQLLENAKAGRLQLPRDVKAAIAAALRG